MGLCDVKRHEWPISFFYRANMKKAEKYRFQCRSVRVHSFACIFLSTTNSHWKCIDGRVIIHMWYYANSSSVPRISYTVYNYTVRIIRFLEYCPQFSVRLIRSMYNVHWLYNRHKFVEYKKFKCTKLYAAKADLSIGLTSNLINHLSGSFCIEW